MITSSEVSTGEVVEVFADCVRVVYDIFGELVEHICYREQFTNKVLPILGSTLRSYTEFIFPS
jgi:hypothetical protein